METDLLVPVALLVRENVRLCLPSIAIDQETSVSRGREPRPSPWIGASQEALTVLTDIQMYPLSAREERVLRTIASKFYQQGCCYAKHETLAKAIKCAKSTLQTTLDELEARGLIAVTRRERTSNITILTQGVIEALKFLRIQRRRIHVLARRGLAQAVDYVQGNVESYTETATEVIEELVSRAQATLASVKESIPKNAQSLTPPDFILENRPKAVKQPIKHSPNFVSAKSTCDDAKKRTGTTKKLREAGVSPKQASKLVHCFGVDRVNLNLELNLHQKAQNPGGFLAMAIRENYAGNHVRPGSEAAAVREREHSTRLFPQSQKSQTSVSTIKQTLVSAPKAKIELLSGAFQELPMVEQNQYEQTAQSIFATSPPSWLVGFLKRGGFEHPAVRGAIRAKAITLWDSGSRSSSSEACHLRTCWKRSRPIDPGAAFCI